MHPLKELFQRFEGEDLAMDIDWTEATNSLSVMASNSAILKNPDREKLMHDIS